MHNEWLSSVLCVYVSTAYAVRAFLLTLWLFKHPLKICCFKSAVEVKLPRLSKRLTKILNQHSIWFSQEVCLGK